MARRLLQSTGGDKGEARKLFNAATADCPVGAAEAAELAVAKLELKRLGAAPGVGGLRPRTPKPAPLAEDAAQQIGGSR